MREPRRWPLHPQPGPLESLSSWLDRLARLYEVPVKQLLGSNLGVVVQIPDLIDHDPPPQILTALSERTGVEPGQLRAMTTAGWVPWLFEGEHVVRRDAEEVFYTYVRQGSVLLEPGEATRPTVIARRPWRGPWLPAHALNRVCPLCAAEPEPRRALIWDLPLTVGCTEHRCRLELADEVMPSAVEGERLQPVPIPEPLATLENYTHQALTVGLVQLPGRTVHAGVWFRLLRSLLDELSLAVTTRTARTRRTLEQIWSTAGEPARAGISVWRPYEHLTWEIQEKLLNAAAVALQLAADGKITARGTLGSALAEPPHGPVYAGDDPTSSPMTVPGVAAAVNTWLDEARTRSGPARHMLQLLTAFDPSPAEVATQRRFLIGLGIPAAFLDLEPPPLPERS